MLALLDLDAFAFRAAASAEDEEVGVAFYRMEEMIRQALHEVEASTYSGWLSFSGVSSYRKDLCSSYKENRKDKPRPRHLEACKQLLVDEWGAIAVTGIEADDALAIAQATATEPTVIVALDKDLLQVPGNHYNFVKNIYRYISNIDGLRNFYKQLLIGDSSDNIRGVDKIGPVKAAKHLDCLDTERLLFNKVRELYKDDERMLMNGRLLWLQRYEGDVWNNANNLFGN